MSCYKALHIYTHLLNDLSSMNVKLAMFLAEYCNRKAKMNVVFVVFGALVLTGTIDSASAQCTYLHCNGTVCHVLPLVKLRTHLGVVLVVNYIIH